jgi:hypothetical protein
VYFSSLLHSLFEHKLGKLVVSNYASCAAILFFMYAAGGAGNNFSLVARRDTLHLSEVT